MGAIRDLWDLLAPTGPERVTNWGVAISDAVDAGDTVFYGDDANTARPREGGAPVVWVGHTGTVPVNAVDDFDVVHTFDPAAAPDAPTGLSATGGDGQVSLSWTASADADGHRVYRNTSNDFGTATQVGADLGAEASSFLDETVTNDTEYFYWVTAFNAVGESDPSVGDSATPTASAEPTVFTYDTVGAHSAQWATDWASAGEPSTVDVLVVAGGGGGGRANSAGGGGGGGGLIWETGFSVNGSETVTVGGGGAGWKDSESAGDGADGGNSVFGTLDAVGGGGAGSGNEGHGRTGGSGGGGGSSTTGGNGGSGTVGQGNDGGDGISDFGSAAAGGGGGASATGANGVTDSGGNGGNGTDMSAELGAAVGEGGWFSGGGGGGDRNGTGGDGGTGGGADGSGNGGTAADAPAATGGGGGGSGGSGSIAGNGGSGVVIVRVP